MRRNRNSSRGGGGSYNRAGDSFLTDHLKDIDLELDLLKRKREMLEQQQQQFIQPLISQRSFNQQPYYLLEQKQSGSNRDFSHLYNDAPQESHKPYGRKRQSDGDWQHNSYPKRSAGQGQRGSSYAGPSPARNQRPNSAQNQQTRSTSSKYGQGKQFIGQRINKQEQRKPSKNFVPNKVTKGSKGYVPPHKRDKPSPPIANRNKVVAAAVKSVEKGEASHRDANRLLPNEVPTRQVTGRLELALGAIYRDIRDKCAQSSHHELLRTAALQRVIKQAIRERIRSAMLGKVVGSSLEIIKEYRSTYPKHTDIEIVNIALEAGGVAPEKDPQPIVVQPKPRPDEGLKVNMIKLIDKHLHEIFDKIEDIYKSEENNKNAEDVSEKDNKMETTEEPVKEEAKVTVVANAGDVLENTNVEETAIEGDVLVDTTKVEEPSKVEAPETPIDNNKTGNDNSEAGKDENIESAKKEAEPEKDKEESAVANTENSVTENTSNLEPFNAENLPHANDYKRLLPRLLKKHIPTILKLLNMNKNYKRAVADLAATTKAKLEEFEKAKTSVETSEQTPKKSSPYVVLPYYVKLMGKPQLPKKRIMNTFLEVFNPKSIKKHRSIHNLLFIGFSEKSDFDAIVEANETVIGRSTLSIRVCDRNNKPEENKDNNTSTSDQNVPQNNDSKDHDNKETVQMDSEADESQVPNADLSENKEVITKSEDQVNIKTEEVPIQGKDVKVDKDLDLVEDKEGGNNAGDIKIIESKDEPKTELLENQEITDENIEQMIEAIDSQIQAVHEKNGDNTEDKDPMETEAESDETNGLNAAVGSSKENEPTVDEKKDQIVELKGTAGKATPTRASTRLANTATTPSTIRTRRTSRLMNN